MQTGIYQKGEIIFKRGDHSDLMYVIRSGSVGIYRDFGESSQKRIVELEPGKFFGEMGMLNHLPRSATAVAEQETELVIVDTPNIRQFFADNPDVALRIMQQLSDRLRSMTNEMMYASRAVSAYISQNKDREKKQGIFTRLRKWADLYDESARQAAEEYPGENMEEQTRREFRQNLDTYFNE